MADESQSGKSAKAVSRIQATAFKAPGVEPPDAADRAAKPPLAGSISSATAAYTAARQGAKKPWWHSQFNLMLAVFALLAAAALLFVALAPPPELTVAQIPTAQTQALTDTDAPWTQSQLAEARTQSQDILKNLLDSKKQLESKGVLEWAPEGFNAALALADEGDEAYKQQEFAGAVSKYQAAVDQMDSLFDFLPREIDRLLKEGNAALSEGKSKLAQEKFNRVIELDNSNINASAGLDRAGRLDQVLSLLAAAKLDEAAYEQSRSLSDLQAASAKLEQAAALQSDYPPLIASSNRVAQAITEKKYRAEMTNAYQALFANRYSRARSAFARALKIKPGDQQASRAMQQALASDQSASIATLLSNAQGYERQEEWSSALNNYQTVLQRDPNQVAAKLGNIRAGARLELDKQIVEMLSDPLAMARTDRKQKATAVLNDALAISNKGTRLNQQIAQLQTNLAQTDAVVKVSFSSDNVTQVTLQKIGSKPISLGQFSRKNLALKPGRYVLSGVRLGYQDVRQDIELVPGSSAVQSFTIQCNEAIQASVSGV